MKSKLLNNSVVWRNFTPLVMGIIAFFMVVGWGILDPKNVSWLLADFDMTLEYLGWAFYRHSPWTFPIGLNPNFGLDISSSIIYSNSMPLFAMVLKPFSSLLSEPFQFWGIWLLLCFVLQAYMSWLVIGLMTADFWIRVFATGLLIFSPPMLSQIGFHNSTVGHFPIMAALYLVLRPNQSKRLIWWALLLPCTLLIHPYTFAMLVALWLADLINKVLVQKKMDLRVAIHEFVCASLTTLIAAWQAGYFMSVNPGETGFGMYRANLLGIFDSSGFDAKNWSYIFSLPSVKANNNYEGFIYLGLGILLVLSISLAKPRLCWSKFAALTTKYPFIALSILGLTLFSLSNNIGIGSINLNIPLSPKLFSIASILRASGRMFWPMFYVITIAAIYFLIRGYSRRAAIIILGFSLVIQIVDTSAAWLEIKEKINNPETQLLSPLSDPFWSAAPKKYSKVIRVPVWNEQAIWEKFTSYAAQHHMGTNSVFMGRVDRQKIERSNLKTKEMLELGNYDPRALYIVEDNYVPIFAKKMNLETDLLARFNEVNVFAPGWKSCTYCPSVGDNAVIDPAIPMNRLTKLGEKIDFSRFGKYSALYLGAGWSVPENWGVWSLSSKALIKLPLPAKTPEKLVISSQAFIAGGIQSQLVRIYINGVFQKEIALNNRHVNMIELPISESMLKGDSLILQMDFPTANSPKALGVGADDRILAIGLESIQYQ